MDRQEANKKLAIAIINVNIISIGFGITIGFLFTVLHGFVTFWISIHLVSYLIYQKNR